MTNKYKEKPPAVIRHYFLVGSFFSDWPPFFRAFVSMPLDGGWGDLGAHWGAFRALVGAFLLALDRGRLYPRHALSWHSFTCLSSARYTQYRLVSRPAHTLAYGSLIGILAKFTARAVKYHGKLGLSRAFERPRPPISFLAFAPLLPGSFPSFRLPLVMFLPIPFSASIDVFGVLDMPAQTWRGRVFLRRMGRWLGFLFLEVA